MVGKIIDIEGISAVTLIVSEMDRAVDFYESLGFEKCCGGRGKGFTSFRAGPCYINLATGTPMSSVWGRVIIYVSDVDAMYARARHAGYITETTPEDAFWGERYFHLRDPDGHEISFARPLSRNQDF
jgi:catechol 2,3-dioxygenase-like lactoylglutathione lyase family enzyme